MLMFGGTKHKNLHLQGALVWDEEGDILHDTPTQQRDIFIRNGRIVEEKPHDALVIDLEGYTLFPAFTNFHDHLELNHYPRTKFRDVYPNAHEWGEDVNARLNDEPFKTLRAYPLWDKLFIGGIKNLLCGATTVVHHGAPHKPMFQRDFPVRVLKRYGWAHSLHFDTDEEVQRSYQATPPDVPWFIHLAEGTDDIARGEYERLKALGCLGANTVLIHGVGLRKEDVMNSHTIYSVGHGKQMPVVWCPTTNIYLLGETKHPRMGWNTQLKLGSDSRLTADGDLLDEMRWVFNYHTDKTKGAINAVILAMQTNTRWFQDARYQFQDVREKDLADFIAIRTTDEHPAIQLCESSRADLALVMRDGVPMIGDVDAMQRFGHVKQVDAVLDGKPKRINAKLAKQVKRCRLQEKGLQVD
jgi:hypothetical protein